MNEARASRLRLYVIGDLAYKLTDVLNDLLHGVQRQQAFKLAPRILDDVQQVAPETLEGT